MKRHIALFSVIAAALALLAGGCTAVLSMYSPTWFWIPIALLALVILGLVILLLLSKRLYTGWLGRLVGALDADQQAALQRFPLPVPQLWFLEESETQKFLAERNNLI